MAQHNLRPSAAKLLQECLGLRARLVSRVITKIYDDALRPHGLRVPQLAMLALAEERGSILQKDVCQDLQLNDSTLSRNLERMRNQGWLRYAATDNARERPYELTPKGRALLGAALPAWRDAQGQAESLLGRAGVSAMDKVARTSGLQL